MKKLILAGYLLVSAVQGKAQWNATGDSFTTGRVGIGTNSLTITNTSVNNLVIGNGTSARGIVINGGPGSDGTFGFARADTLRARFRYNYPTGALFFEKGNNRLLTILDNGNTGIGTMTPAEKFAVNGNIRAKEVKVETANWPDYVFAEDYRLPDLKATENFIRKNKHLPGMPSAATVEQEGISLGEMNRKLLEKVEELTLYLIEKERTEQQQNKRMREQDERIREQDERISNLELKLQMAKR